MFFRRTGQELATQSGDVFFDINGKNVGKLAATDCFVDLPAGQYQIRMYKSHAYGSMIGYADITVRLQEGESLLVRYHAPAVINQPGHITLYDYNRDATNTMARELDNQINAERAKQKEQEERTRAGTRSAVKWIIIGSVAVAVTIVLSYAIIYSSLLSMF